ncbi:MAG: type II toxin-antitoxin system RelE/ParE family toxin [Alphaproteobacteria bacterium]|nr:type II toxin-antitoxin system RelE/ParE family toxin [Alphaproteobacteria bacterium]
MKVRLLAAAAAELDEAVAWYAAQSPGLERAFLDQVREAGRRVVRHPQAWHLLDPAGIRRIRLRRFPYGLIYTVTDDEVLVLAIAHLRRRPTYWRSRRRDEPPPP